MLRVTSVLALAVFAIFFGSSVAATTTTTTTTPSTTTSPEKPTDDPTAKVSSKDVNITSSMEQGSTEESRLAELMAAMMDCNDTFRIEMGYVEALTESGSFPDETDRTPKCYVRCVLEKTGVFDGDKYDPARTALVFAGERAGRVMTDIEDLAAKCATGLKDTCKCERSYKYMKCLMESEIKEYFA